MAVTWVHCDGAALRPRPHRDPMPCGHRPWAYISLPTLWVTRAARRLVALAGPGPVGDVAHQCGEAAATDQAQHRAVGARIQQEQCKEQHGHRCVERWAVQEVGFHQRVLIQCCCRASRQAARLIQAVSDRQPRHRVGLAACVGGSDLLYGLGAATGFPAMQS